MTQLKPTNPKNGDIVLYKTPKGKIKHFLVGSRLWYGRHEYPNRAYLIIRKGRLSFEGELQTPVFLTADNLKPFISNEMEGNSKPIHFSWKGVKMIGYKAELLPDVCDLNPLLTKLSGGKTITETLNFKDTK